MFLVQLFVPLASATQPGAKPADLEQLQRELAQQFGGVTAFVSQPAAGLWKPDSDQIIRDSVILLEVMVAELDRAWWARWREQIERRFRQDNLLIRAVECAQL
jgi:hypothetical protein